MPYEELVPLAVKLLQIPAAVIEAAIAQEIADGVVIADPVEGKPCVFLAPLYQARVRHCRAHRSLGFKASGT
jgi:exodeoxyribonuclease V alpha subunit